MALQSFSRLMVVLAVLFAAAGCAHFGVKPAEKERLADRTMKFDPDGQEAADDEHILGNREGAAGGHGSGGGGCGCN